MRESIAIVVLLCCSIHASGAQDDVEALRVAKALENVQCDDDDQKDITPDFTWTNDGWNLTHASSRPGAKESLTFTSQLGKLVGGDNGDEQWWFEASKEYAERMRCAYGGVLKFRMGWLEFSDQGRPMHDRGYTVVIESEEMGLQLKAHVETAVKPTNYELPLHGDRWTVLAAKTDGEWDQRTLGAPVDDAEMLATVAMLSGLRFRGGRFGGPEVCWLSEVRASPPKERPRRMMQGASRLLRTAAEVCPPSKRCALQWMMAKMQMNEQQYEKADGSFQGVAIDHIGTVTASEAWLQIGHSGYLQRKFEQASQWYVKTMRRGLNSTRSFIEAYSNAAVTFQRRRDLTTAMAVYERLFRAYPWLKPFFSLSLLGQLGINLPIGDIAAALANIDASFRLEPVKDGEAVSLPRDLTPPITDGIYGSWMMDRWPRHEGKPVVVFFCRLKGQASILDNQFGPSSRDVGIGGSEEATILLSQELARQGFWVEVYGNPAMEDIGPDEFGVVWKPFYTWRMNDMPDAFVAWRNPEAIHLAPNAKRRFLWIHDPQLGPTDMDYYSEEYLSKIDGIFVLTKHSLKQFTLPAQRKAILTTNGLDQQLLADGPNKQQSFMYSAWPSAGLEVILENWRRIRRSLPEAVLHVYYGFERWWANSVYNDDAEFKGWIVRMKDLLKQDGIVYHGMVGHEEISKAYAESGFYLYPSDIPETCPVNLIKAQAMGAIPITSRLPDSAIPEIAEQFDMGPNPRRGKISENEEWIKDWVRAVILATSQDLDDHRLLMKRHARKLHSWPAVAKQWAPLLTEGPKPIDFAVGAVIETGKEGAPSIHFEL